ncbi:MAG: T9SS type A sorting domain-containing protein, partial [Ignavibacteriae bacterium]|nr:T9SS type A sorting domain-containing protein [Ignavibacteriota bacterium]
NTIQNLNDVFFVNSETGYVCGDSGVVLKTADGGVNWVNLKTNTISKLNCIYFYDDNYGISVGKDSKIIKTINGGVNWSFGTINANTELITTYLLNSYEGFASSNINTYRTTNGGTDWELYFALGGLDMQFTDSITGYNAGGNGNIIKTTNRGLNWFIQSLNVSGETYGLHFLNSNNGYAVTISGQISKTTNGGTTWIPQTTISGNSFKSVYFTDKNNGFIVGNFGTILKTTNGGLVFVNINDNIISEEFSLLQNYPNPFNSSTVINYEIKIPSEVSLKLYNIEGKEIQTLVKEYHKSGSYEVKFDASKLSTGIYFYSLFADNILKSTKKLTFIK